MTGGKFFPLLLVGLLLAACGEPTPIPPAPVVVTGVVKTCDYGMGEEHCGRCYCLETEGAGCEIIDWRGIGDLGYAVGRTVQVEGGRDVRCTEMCPCQIKLFKVKIGMPTDGGYRFVEPSPTPSPLPPTEALPIPTATPSPTSMSTSTPTPTVTSWVLRESACNTPEFETKVAPARAGSQSGAIARTVVRAERIGLSAQSAPVSGFSGLSSGRRSGLCPAGRCVHLSPPLLFAFVSLKTQRSSHTGRR